MSSTQRPKKEKEKQDEEEGVTSSSQKANTNDDNDLESKEEDLVREAKKRSLHDFFRPIQHSKSTEAKSKASTSSSASTSTSNKKPKTCEIVEILSSDDEDDKIDIADDDDDDDDDVMIIDKPTAMESSQFAAAKSQGDMDDEEIVEIGTKNAMDLPHMRQHCTKFIFRENNSNNNKNYCSKCFCYVCDKLASECETWSNHCNATDKGQQAYAWKKKRDGKKNGTTSSSSSSCVYPGRLGSLFNDLVMMRRDHHGYDSEHGYDTEHRYDYFSSSDESTNCFSCESPFSTYMRMIGMKKSIGEGPFKPDDEKLAQEKDHGMTQCRKCKWWSRIDKIKESNISISEHGHDVISQYDWCHACGRVASEKDFGKKQHDIYKPKDGDVSLGTRNIPFRIKGRDPRKISPYDENWKKYEGKEDGWTYDEAEMKEEFFRHRIGKSPNLSFLFWSLPVLEEEKIPEKGFVNLRGTMRSPYNGKVSGFETEALLIESRNDRVILEELHQFTKNFGASTNRIGLSMEATWDGESDTGNLSITLTVATGSSSNSVNYVPHYMIKTIPRLSSLLGAWYSIFPFKLSELTTGLSAEKLSKTQKERIVRTSTGIIPTIPNKDRETLLELFDDEDETFENYNNESKAISSSLSFISSSGQTYNGCICNDDISFRGILRNYYQDTLREDLFKYHDQSLIGNFSFGTSHAGRAMGIKSTHRRMLSDQDHSHFTYMHQYGKTYFNGPRSYLEDKELAIAVQCLSPQMQKVKKNIKSMRGIMVQLENLHHKPVDHVDGLTVELLDFQQEAVGWANERERAPFGLNSFVWTKIPSETKKFEAKRGKEYPLIVIESTPVDLYYSPVLDSFSLEKPNVVRGGIIAQEMGLGKTVISLSIILQNPAPLIPISGTPVRTYTPPKTPASVEVPCAWPTELIKPSELESVSTKRAQYFSRGTLVVCNVSLVGQWIDEAKSKLKDPGLVYSYHGGSRKRCAEILAKNSIVVTTYATLTSDDNLHRQKSKDPNYCAPCEQVMWWRIICDESHSMKDQNTKLFKTLEKLRAVNKWCVTGTPMNTSVNDLKSQLKFLGFQNIPRLQSIFPKSDAMTKRGRCRDTENLKNDGSGFLCFMRNVMVRHAIQMKGRNAEANIMALPPKTEKVLVVTFTTQERKEYKKLEQEAVNFYQRIKTSVATSVSKEYLKLSSALLPLRLACSGGTLDEGQAKRKDFSNLELECPVCFEHVEDIESFFKGLRNAPCPNVDCRSDLKFSYLRRVSDSTLVQRCIEKIAKENENKTPKGKKVRKSKDVTIKDVIFKSKFNRLLEELTKIRDNEPESKSLVFSQFKSTLQWMKQELPKHGFSFRTLSGDMTMPQRAKALREFQQDPPTTIFLLSMRSGAVGINLTQANRIFLMEPAMNPALEAQAVGRVYRLGQRKRVEVVRLQIEDSIESRIVKLAAKKYGLATEKPDAPKTSDDDKNADKDSDSNEEKKSCTDTGDIAVEAAGVPLIGHMFRDKASLVEDEFDFLFGV